MKFEITTTGEKVEKANHLLSLAIEAAKDNPLYCSQNDITKKDLDKIESFRKQMLSGFFKQFKSKKVK